MSLISNASDRKAGRLFVGAAHVAGPIGEGQAAADSGTALRTTPVVAAVTPEAQRPIAGAQVPGSMHF